MAYVDLKSKFISDLDSELNPDLSKERIIILNKEEGKTTANTVLVEDFHENNRPGYRHLESGVLLLKGTGSSSDGYKGSNWNSDYMGEGVEGINDGEPYFKTQSLKYVTNADTGKVGPSFNGYILVDDLVPNGAKAVYVTVGNTSGNMNGWIRFYSWHSDGITAHFGYHNCYGDRWINMGESFMTAHSGGTVQRDVPWSFPIVPLYDFNQKKWYRGIRIIVDNRGRWTGHQLWLRGYWI